MLTLLLFVGCGPVTLPSDEGAFEDKQKQVGKQLAARARKCLLNCPPYGPPPPEPAITSSDCGRFEDGGPVKGQCITDELKCGSTIVGHTVGGVKLLNTRFYEKNFCWPATVRHDGGDERMYTLDLPEWTEAYITLDAPCANLSLFAFKWSDPGVCPSSESMVTQCEGEVRPGGGGSAGPNRMAKSQKRIDFQSGQRPTSWIVVVEGQEDEEGPFALTVQCIKENR